MATHEDMVRRAWRLHDAERKPLSEIAKRMRIGEADARALVTEVWGMTAAEKVEAGIRNAMPWEGDAE